MPAAATDLKPLLEMAASRFDQDISLAEQRLFKAAMCGKNADCSDLTANDRIIRADRFLWLCTNPEASAQVTRRGLSLREAKIDGNVDLRWEKIPFPIMAITCVFSGTIDLRRSEMSFVNLGGSSVKQLNANAARFGGDIFLRNGFKADGGVNLISAKIDGSLDCGGGQFIGNDKVLALNANSARINGDVFLRNDFKADGGVDLISAKIDGSLNCNGGQFIGNDKVLALNANGAKIKGTVFLRDGFKADGGVNLISAKIDGSLDCGGGQFIGNDKVLALNANSARINGDVFLRDGFKADGGVDFTAVRIDGGLVCDGGQFIGNDKALALSVGRTEIKGHVLLRKGFRAEGGVDLRVAKIHGNLECDRGQLVGNKRVPALNADGAEIDSSVYMSDGFKAEQEIVFCYARVGRNFQLRGAELPENTSINLQYAKVGTLLNHQDSWPNKDNLRLDGFIYDQIDDRACPNAEVQLAWLRLQPRDRFSSQPFEQLAAVFGRMGLKEDAKKVMIAKNEDHATHLHWRLAWLWYGFFGKLIGYGYRPWRAFWVSVALIVIGCGLFNWGYASKIVTPTEKEAYAVYVDKSGKGDHFERYPVFDPFVYSVETFVPLLKLGLSDHWMPNAALGDAPQVGFMSFPKWGVMLRGYLWCHIIAGWVLTTLWVGGITGLVKT